jgi:hypothetical protein
MGAMRRREFVRALGAAAVVVSFNARTQEAGRIYRVGGVTASPRNAQIIVAMFEELRRAGFVEGQNLAIDWRTYGTNPDLIPELMADLVKAHVDVIYDAGDPAIRAVARCNKDDSYSRDYRRYVGDDYGEGLRLAAGYIDRTLKGERPADLPLQAATKYELVINMKTAKALGLSVSNKMQLLADEVIE